MSALSTVLQAQAAAEGIMLDECTITRPDPSDFANATLTVYSGRCRLRMIGRTSADDVESSGELSDRHRCRVDVPVSADAVKFNDLVTITASIDPQLVGFDCFVRDVPTITFASARRLICERSRR